MKETVEDRRFHLIHHRNPLIIDTRLMAVRNYLYKWDVSVEIKQLRH
jgi:hypothetical protein